ncbi:MAG: SH3 domain-containing protein, partial [Anaerolineales bacterium]|nr:SH3 domain-containing protein [Anaerolineales bacterium]
SLNDKGEENKGNIKSNRKKVEVTSYPSNYSQQTVQPARSFQAQTDWGKVIGFILVAALIIFICIALFSAIAGAIFVENTPLPSSTSTSSYVVPATVIVTKTFRSTSTQLQPIRLTKTPKPSDLAGYSCPDKSKIKLRVGEKAIVPYYDVNLREQPIVPEVWDANIVVMLRKGDTMLVIGGPKCAHEGTWWEVKTDNGYTGWVRELQPNKILIEPLD